MAASRRARPLPIWSAGGSRDRARGRGITGDLGPCRPGPTPADLPRGSATVKIAQGKGTPEGSRRGTGTGPRPKGPNRGTLDEGKPEEGGGRGRTRRANGKPGGKPAGGNRRTCGEAPDHPVRVRGFGAARIYDAAGRVLAGLRELRIVVRQLPGGQWPFVSRAPQTPHSPRASACALCGLLIAAGLAVIAARVSVRSAREPGRLRFKTLAAQIRESCMPAGPTAYMVTGPSFTAAAAAARADPGQDSTRGPASASRGSRLRGARVWSRCSASALGPLVMVSPPCRGSVRHGPMSRCTGPSARRLSCSCRLTLPAGGCARRRSSLLW